MSFFIEITPQSHISCCVFDSTWEASEAYELDRDRNDRIVDAWVKSDRLGFEILYISVSHCCELHLDYATQGLGIRACTSKSFGN
jgi:hypothetical protein